MQKPMIGVVPLWDDEKQSIWMVPGYLEGIEHAGGIPVILPLTTCEQVLSPLIEMLDGFLFTGGHDVSPSLYGEEMAAVCGATCAERDTMETYLFIEGALRRGKPALGICRGIQLFNSILGGTLYQDIPSQRESMLTHKQLPPYDMPAHMVEVLHETPLSWLVGRKTLAVNSYHHQAIKTLAPSLMPMAQAEDGTIEAVCMPEHRFVWAVQWHPEFSLEQDASIRLFSAFVAQCTKHAEICQSRTVAV